MNAFRSNASKNFATVALFSAILIPSLAAQDQGTAKSLSDVEQKGQKLFYQRCAACHSPVPPRYRTYGPLLHKGVLAERGDDAVKTKILDGSLLMPGWKYSLKPADIENIIAYLKTVSKEAVTFRPSNQGSGEQVGGD